VAPSAPPAVLGDHADTPLGLRYPARLNCIVTGSRSGGKKHEAAP